MFQVLITRTSKSKYGFYYTVLINSWVELINKIEYRLISCGGSLTWLDIYRHDHTWGNRHE